MGKNKPEDREYDVVNKSLTKVDGKALVNGKPVFAGDYEYRDGLVAGILSSPKAHAEIVNIDTSKAKKVDGVVSILHHGNVDRAPHTTAGQGYPEPSPYDAYIFDNRVRYVGDRVAAVAGESREAVNEGLSKIDVEYRELDPVFDPKKSRDTTVLIHDEEDSTGIYDPERNIAANVDIEIGDPEKVISQSDVVVEEKCRTQFAQHTPIEPHVTTAYLDEHDRLIVKTSTQVPFHVRRILAQVLEVPISRIRVIKPRIGGGFGVKQEFMLEDITSLFALRTGRPVTMYYSREEEFISSRCRHPMEVEVTLGADKEGKLEAIKMKVLSNTGAYGTHSLTVLSNVGSKTLPLYNEASDLHFFGDAVYTNLPVPGAYRGYGAPQGYFPLEFAMEKLAEKVGKDPIEIRKLNHIREGETSPIFEKLGEGKEGTVQYINSCRLDECIDRGAREIGWKLRDEKQASNPHRKKGFGMAINMQGSGIPLIDMAAARLKLNEDGSFNLYVGATDLGTGSDTVLSQIAAEVLGVELDDIIVYSSDTDFTPFDSGAYASSTTYVSGNAVRKAAEKAKDRIVEVFAKRYDEDPEEITWTRGIIKGANNERSLQEFALSLTSGDMETNQEQIEVTASEVPEESPPPFAANFVELEVDIRTGEIDLQRYVSAVDCGTAINPNLAEGQMEGAIVNGIGYALTEEMEFNESGRMTNPSFFNYKVPNTEDIPEIKVILVESSEPTGPMGAKSVGEIGINGPIPAIANAVRDATGIELTTPPFTPEKVWKKMKAERDKA
ncbi:MAG: molybdopterin cofactor-binding domain-containing protein [Candidatus Bipolaricaulota bacterium]|nr:molybdopterin-dependent oxidoreductase [Candidatus Bipolaricaulota bacterium]MBS3791843.1 molybdopterin-dependent oxidoreductase [Candidatus Bipolaricaulota bacterium]